MPVKIDDDYGFIKSHWTAQSAIIPPICGNYTEIFHTMNSTI